MINFLGYDRFVWFLGVVEDRNDPLKLGRNRVRIFGLHTDDDSVLKKEDLPWAVPIMPINSASYSGVGTSPTGLVEGSLVVGFFVDGDETQVPMIFGTIPVHPLDELDDPPPETAEMSSGGGGGGGSSDSGSGGSGGKPTSEKPRTTVKTSSAQTKVLPKIDREVLDRSIDGTHKVDGMSEEETKALMHQMKMRESGGNYRAENQYGYIGGYQFGGAALSDLGYVDASKCKSNKCLDDPSVWTGKGGVYSKEDFLNNPSVQDTAMRENLQMNRNRLERNGTISSSDSPDRVAGLLGVSHLLGAGGARKFANGNDGKDANGTSGSHYYALGSAAVKSVNNS